MSTIEFIRLIRTVWRVVTDPECRNTLTGWALEATVGTFSTIELIRFIMTVRSTITSENILVTLKFVGTKTFVRFALGVHEALAWFIRLNGVTVVAQTVTSRMRHDADVFTTSIVDTTFSVRVWIAGQ